MIDVLPEDSFSFSYMGLFIAAFIFSNLRSDLRRYSSVKPLSDHDDLPKSWSVTCLTHLL